MSRLIMKIYLNIIYFCDTIMMYSFFEEIYGRFLKETAACLRQARKTFLTPTPKGIGLRK